MNIFYYLAIICFMLFKKQGAFLQIKDVFEVVKKLQISPFEEKLRIILNIIDINDNHLILKSEFEAVATLFLLWSFDHIYFVFAVIKMPSRHIVNAARFITMGTYNSWSAFTHQYY